MEEPGYWSPGVWERLNSTTNMGMSMNAVARDRNVRLKPEWLQFMLGQVRQAGCVWSGGGGPKGPGHGVRGHADPTCLPHLPAPYACPTCPHACLPTCLQKMPAPNVCSGQACGLACGTTCMWGRQVGQAGGQAGMWGWHVGRQACGAGMWADMWAGGQAGGQACGQAGMCMWGRCHPEPRCPAACLTFQVVDTAKSVDQYKRRWANLTLAYTFVNGTWVPEKHYN